MAPCNDQAAYTLADYYVPDFDYILMLVNDERYGGSGGDIAVASINETPMRYCFMRWGIPLAC